MIQRYTGSRSGALRLLILVLTFVLVGCGSGADEPPAETTAPSTETTAPSTETTTSEEIAPVRVIESLTGLWGLTVRTAEEQGFFDEAGVTVEQLSFGEAEDNVLLASGGIDFASLAPIDVAVMRNEGQDVVNLGGLFNQQSMILVNGDDDRTLADLEGTAHGQIGLGSTTSRQLQVLLEVTDGIDYISFFDHVVSGTPTLEPLLSRGEVESIAMFPPRSVQYEAQGYRAVYGPLSSEWEGVTGHPLLLGGLVFRTDWVEENPETVRRFIEALRTTADYIEANAREVVEANAELLGIDEASIDAFVAALETGDYYDVDLSPERVEAEQRFLEEAAALGLIDEVPSDLFGTIPGQ